MNINLTLHLEEMVRQKVDSGLYTSASEVVHEALRMMEETDQMRLVKLDQLRFDLQTGLDSGPYAEWDPDEIKSAGQAMRGPKALGEA